jgi:hypothetical protein
MSLVKTYKVEDVHLITFECPPTFLLFDKVNIVPGLALSEGPQLDSVDKGIISVRCSNQANIEHTTGTNQDIFIIIYIGIYICE